MRRAQPPRRAVHHVNAKEPSMSRALCCACVVTLAACGGPVTAQPTAKEQALATVKRDLQGHLDALTTASAALCAAAPAGRSTGWDSAADRPAIDAMKAQWKSARFEYESIEGAIAALFPELDVATDARYDGFLETATDTNLFDDQTVTGMHALERILWSDSIPPEVVTFEQGALGPRYQPARFPQTLAEAQDFKGKLCARLVTDCARMRTDFAGLTLDAASAYRGAIASMAEQVEKVKNASLGSEESRYAQTTLADLRANLSAGKETSAAFKAWLLEAQGSALDSGIAAAFARLDAAYALNAGDAIPRPPATWSETAPSAADLATPFGKLYTAVNAEADEKREGSLVHAMGAAADLLNIPHLAN
jgi:iron uptake system component EfeO